MQRNEEGIRIEKSRERNCVWVCSYSLCDLLFGEKGYIYTHLHLFSLKVENEGSSVRLYKF